MRIHSPCLWPSLRQWSARCDFIRFACCPLGGNPCAGFTMQLRLLCLLHSLLRCSAGHTMRLLATPVAFSVAIHACPTMRFHSPGPAPRQSSACCPSPRRSSACSCMRFSLAMPVALSAALELLMRFHSLPSRRKSCEGLPVLVFSCTASRGHLCRIFLGIPRSVGIPVSPALTWRFLFGFRLGLH